MREEMRRFGRVSSAMQQVSDICVWESGERSSMEMQVLNQPHPKHRGG